MNCTPTTFTIKAALATMALSLITAATVSAQTVIVAENFGGAGIDLDGTTAETFDSGITSATVVGSNTWSAATSFNDDGSLVGGNNHGAYLNMGSYIDEAKGTATGKFTLSTTLTEVSGGAFAGFGFFQSNTPSTSVNFTGSTVGAATFIYRETKELDGFAVGSSNSVDGDIVSGNQLLTVVLDLTNHDNSSDFGTVTFYDGDASTGSSLGSYAYTSDVSFGSIGFTSAGPSVDSTFSSFELTQVPEPSALLLSGFCLLALLRRRR